MKLLSSIWDKGYGKKLSGLSIRPLRLLAAVSLAVLILKYTTNAQSNFFPDTAETPGTSVSFGQLNTSPAVTGADSLQLRLLEIAIEEAQIQVSQSNFLHRLIPHINFSASFGVSDIVFYNASGTTPYLLPKDAYRLSVSLSLGDLFDFSKHHEAQLRLDHLEIEYKRAIDLKSREIEIRRLQLAEFCEVRSSLSEELKMKEDVARFNDLRFRQGKIAYDQLVRSQLDVLTLRRSLLHVNREIEARKNSLSISP